MSQRFFVIVRFMVILVLLPGMAVRDLAASDLHVETFPGEYFPGQAVLILVTADQDITSVSASLGDQRIPFFSGGDKKLWMGLAGLDLDIPPGEQTLTYRAEFPNGFESSGTMILKVQKKEFPVERITVDEKYVHLSSKDLKRYKREQKLLDAIFSVQNPDRLWDQGFAVPLNVENGSRFGLRRIINGEPRNPHSGADLKAGTGTEVRASNAGRVVFAGDLFFSGNSVILDHGFGLYTMYAHLKDMSVAKGASVKKEDIIGHVGATGRVTGPHLHWGVKLNGARVDPFSLVSLPLSSGTTTGRITSPEVQAPTDRETGSPALRDPGSDPGDESR